MIDRLSEKLITATVVNIEWERIHLHLYIKVEVNDPSVDTEKTPLSFYLLDLKNIISPAKCKVLGCENGVYHLHLNVTNNGENSCIPSGKYKIEVCSGGVDDVASCEALADCEAGLEIVPRMDECSRNFLYSNGRRVYTTTFTVEEGQEILPFVMTTLASDRYNLKFPSRARLHKRFHPIKDLKATWLSKRNMIRMAYAFLCVVNKSKRKKTILFMTEQSERVASNLKAVSGRMVARGMDKDYNILYSARAASEKGQSIKSWFTLINKLACSGTVFLDDHAPCLDWLKLRDDTKVIQLWHAGAGFKSSGYSRWGHENCPNAVSCHRQYNYGIAGSKNIAHFFSEVWGMNDEQVLATGMPRMDEYLNPEYRAKKTEEIYNEYPICKGKKVILFAPTYRGRNKKDAHYPYELIDFDGLYDLCGEEYVVLFKMHPWVHGGVPIRKGQKGRFIDVGKYPNINDLFYITDLLITDYSSNIFEYSLMKKPMLFFAFDKIQYSFSRGFHRPYEESAPGKVCYTFEEVLAAIRDEDYEFEKVQEYVDHHFDYIDSGASDRVIDWLVLDQMPQDVVDALERVKRENEYRQNLDFTFGGKRLPLALQALTDEEEQKIESA
ncbi:MAG: CDP-glycerol glycerophosphotransferase family protein [Lachnospiraceae bacterium]|nr:CDP-glycerol glycerophosphotransferase family protein [Lachnospiraceae bacterium]